MSGVSSKLKKASTTGNGQNDCAGEDQNSFTL